MVIILNKTLELLKWFYTHSSMMDCRISSAVLSRCIGRSAGVLVNTGAGVVSMVSSVPCSTGVQFRHVQLNDTSSLTTLQ